MAHLGKEEDIHASRHNTRFTIRYGLDKSNWTSSSGCGSSADSEIIVGSEGVVESLNTSPWFQHPERDVRRPQDGPGAAAAPPCSRTVLPPRVPQPSGVRPVGQGWPRRSI